MQTSLDHLIVGISELPRGMDFVEHTSGVRPAVGGVHPGRGTRNALLSLGPRCYLEILAPDPQQNSLAWFYTLPQLKEPRLIGWMIHPKYASKSAPERDTHELELLAQELRKAGIQCEDPSQNSRLRADGRILRWKLLRLTGGGPGVALGKDIRRPTIGDLLPMIIEWDAESPHPAVDAPSGCRLINFEICSSEDDKLRQVFDILGLDVRVCRYEIPQLRARIVGPKGSLELRS